MSLPSTETLIRHCHDVTDTVALSYEDRFFRRKKLTSVGGVSFVADFASTTSLNHGDALELPDGTRIGIAAAPEELLEVRGPHLVRLAWHIGNRHTPCQISEDRLLIQRDHVLRDMLEKLGAELSEVVEAFTPEGGAYGHGRTHSHEH
ncbi:MAG: urease accessory protein UreE [Marinovum sp.]|nr:urease accessory protein UreE [Marinovum sp.]